MANRRELALPDFQRDFVWDPNKVIELLESVSNGWPIGSLLVLEGPQPFGVRSIDSAPDVDSSSARFFLLDGQQRVTALYHAVTGRGELVYFADLARVGTELSVFGWAHRDRYAAISATRPHVSEVKELVDTRSFRESLRELSGSAAADAETARAAALGYLIDDRYRLPAIVMNRGIELEALTRIFETLNRTGVRLDAFDLMVAVLRPGSFLLRDKWEAAQQNFPLLKEFKAQGVEILKLIALWQRDVERKARSEGGPSNLRRVQGVRQRDVLNTPASTVIKEWDRAVSAYERAIEFVQTRCGVRDYGSMPSWSMALPIAYHLDADMPGLDLENWYWRSIAMQTYAQGANTQVTADVDRPGEAIARPLDSEVLAQQLDEPARSSKILRLGIQGLLVRDGALDAITGGPLEGELREFSVPRALNGEILPPTKEPLFDIAVTTKDAFIHTRKELREFPGAVRLGGAYSQGFPDGHSLESLDARRQARAEYLSSRLGAL